MGLAKAYSNLGKIYSFRDGKIDFTKAIQLHEKAVARTRKVANHQADIIRAVRSAGETEDFEIEFHEAPHIKRARAQALSGQGYCLKKLRRYDDAIAKYEEAIESDRGFASPYNDLAMIYIFVKSKRNLSMGIGLLKKALDLEPGCLPALCNLGTAYQMTGKLEDAVQVWKRALELGSNSVRLYAALVSTLSRISRTDEAISVAKKALEKWPRNGQIHAVLGGAYLSKGQHEAAQRASQKAIDLGFRWPGVYCSVGHSYLNLGQFEKALEWFRRGHALRSKVQEWPYPSGKWIQECERMKRFAPRLEEILRGENLPASAVDVMVLAYVATYQKRYGAAVGLFKQAFDQEPELAHQRDPIGPPLQTNLSTAADVALWAALGDGVDAKNFDDADRTHWRKQALAWLQGELTTLEEQLAEEKVTKKELIQWLCCPSGWTPPGNQPDTLAPFRDEANLARLPEDERRAWKTLWADAVKLLESCR